MYSCFCSSIIISFVLFSWAYSSPLTTSNHHSLNRTHIPITQTLNSYAVLELSRYQNQNSTIETHIYPTQPQSIMATQRQYDHKEYSQPETQKSSAGTEMSPTLPKNTTPQTRQELEFVEETPQPETQKSSEGTEISPTLPKNTTPQTRQEQEFVRETPQRQIQNSSSTIPSPFPTQNLNPILRTRRQYNNTDILQLPNGPPLRFQRPRVSMRRPVGQQNHGDILQQRHGDVMQQRYDNTVQQSDFSVNSDKRPHGAPQKFCNMFGCDCAPPPGDKCCVGYRYDKRANKCRQVVG